MDLIYDPEIDDPHRTALDFEHCVNCVWVSRERAAWGSPASVEKDLGRLDSVLSTLLLFELDHPWCASLRNVPRTRYPVPISEACAPCVSCVSRLPPCLFTGTETMRRNEFRTWRARGPCCVNGGGVVHVRGSREHSQPPREVGARVS